MARRRAVNSVSEEEAKDVIARLQARYQEAEARDPEVFAQNLDRLTQMHGLTRREVAEKIGARYQWFRRLVTRGLTRIDARNQAALDRLAALLGLAGIEDLWSPDLIEFKVVRPGLDRDADPHTHVVWRQREFWPYARKLAHILASGQHEYLKDLIDALYATVPKDAFKEPEPGASFWSSSEGD